MSRRYSVFLLLLLISGLSHASDRLRENELVSGSIIKDVTVTSTGSLKKRYSDLSPAEIEDIKSQYKDMPKGDEPPYPVNGMKKLMQDMATIQRSAYAEGVLYATVEVDEQGVGDHVKFYKVPDSRMTAPVAAALVNTHYKPAICSGKPCVMEFPLTIHFKRE